MHVHRATSTSFLKTLNSSTSPETLQTSGLDQSIPKTESRVNRAARYSKINLDIVLSCLNIQYNN